MINGLGMINTLASPAKNSSSEIGIKKEGFSSLLMGNFQMQVQEDVKVETFTEQKPILLGSLEELLNLLSTESIDDLEENSSLLKLPLMESSTDEDALAVILSFLGINQEQLNQRIDEWKLGQGPDSIETADSSLLNNKNVNLFQPDNMLAMVEQINQQLTENETILTSKQAQQLIEIIKIMELASKHRDLPIDDLNKFSNLSNELQILKDSIETILQRLKQLNVESDIKQIFAKMLDSRVNDQVVSNDVKPKETLNSLQNQSASFQMFQPMTKIEQLTLTLEHSGKKMSTDQFVKEFEGIMAKSQFLKTGNTGRLFIKLYPEHLGALRIELIQKDQSIVARILTTTNAARESLESQLNGLKQAFSNQNIVIDRIEVSQQQQMNFQQERFFGRDQNQGQQHQQSHKETNEIMENEDAFTTSLEEALLNTEA